MREYSTSNTFGGNNARNFFIVLILTVAFGFFIYPVSSVQANGDTIVLEDLSFDDIVNTQDYYLPENRVDFEFADAFEDVWVPDCGHVCAMVEQGYIEIKDGYYDNPLPICLTQEEIEDWFILIESHGGYELWGGYVDIWQKGEWKGRLWIEYEWLGKIDCCHDQWLITFYLDGCISLDSSFYPEIIDGMFGLCGGEWGNTIPGKEVDMWIYMDWTGCEPGNDQDFTVKFILFKKENPQI